MKFYYHKLGRGNELAVRFLDEVDNPLKKPAVAIFFGRSTRTRLPSGERGKQVRAFYEAGDPGNRGNRLITVVGKGFVWVLRPAGEVVEREDKGGLSGGNDLLKLMPVRILKRSLLKEVPHVLASINADTNLSRGTYREIGHWGNQKAICRVIGQPLPNLHMQSENCGAAQLLECLSSVEFETLVAKLFEAAGCFVPAHRGGVMQDVDLFAHNDSAHSISLGDVRIPGHGSKAIQVKCWRSPTQCPPEVDLLIGFDAQTKAAKCRDAQWVLDRIREFPSVREWFRRSLDWLPQAFFNHYGM